MFKNMNIKLKIIFITVVGLILLAVILATVSVTMSKNALVKKSYDALTSSRDNITANSISPTTVINIILR